MALAGGAVSCPKAAFLGHLTPSPGLAHGSRHERFPRHLWHLPRDYELAIRWLRPSFLTRDHWTPGRQCPRLSHSYAVAAGAFANVRAGDTDKKYNCSAAFRFEVPDRICGLGTGTSNRRHYRRDIHGFAPLRYLDAGKAAVHAARSRQCAD